MHFKKERKKERKINMNAFKKRRKERKINMNVFKERKINMNAF